MAALRSLASTSLGQAALPAGAIVRARRQSGFPGGLSMQGPAASIADHQAPRHDAIDSLQPKPLLQVPEDLIHLLHHVFRRLVLPVANLDRYLERDRDVRVGPDLQQIGDDVT